MSISVVLEVVIGLSFVFATLALIASGTNELISSVLKLRARTLEKGIRNLLPDGDDATLLYEHPLIQALYRPGRFPSYIPPHNFALALLDTKVKVAVGAVGEQIAAIPKAIQDLPPGRVRETLDVLWREARGDVDRFRQGIEGWFDDAMERVSGWYRRMAQAILLCLGVLLAVGLNVNAVTLTQRLWADPSLRAAIVAQAQPPASPPASATPTSVTESLQSIQSELKTINGLSLPIGWAKSTRPTNWWGALVGWLFTALAVSMGAPFWFDLLGRVARLRSTGGRPQTALPPSAETEPAVPPRLEPGPQGAGAEG